jgi:hypothetical protein
MPAIFTTPEEIETWLTAGTDEALSLQRPLPDGALKVVMTGEKEDSAAMEILGDNTFPSTRKSRLKLIPRSDKGPTNADC